MKLIKIEFTSEVAKVLSDRVNLLSWAIGGVNYIGFNLTGYIKVLTVVIGWLIFQYASFAFLKVSSILKKEEENNGTNKNAII